MGGATIYQLEQVPISSDEMLTVHCADDTPFRYTVANYLYKVDDRKEAGAFLRDSLQSLDHGRGLVDIAHTDTGYVRSITFHEGFREACFAASYVQFAKLLAEVTVASNPTSFSDGRLEMPIFMLNEAYDRKFGDYVYTADGEFITFDEFIRTMEADVPYYLGGIMNYRC